MKLSLADIIKKIARLFMGKRQGSLDVMRDPVGDWGKLVSIFSIVFIAIVALHIYLFYKLNSGDFGLPTNTTMAPGIINKVTLKNVVDYYDAKRNKLERLIEEKPELIDPAQ